MKIKDLIENIDKTKLETVQHLEYIANEVDVNDAYGWFEDSRIKSVGIKEWYCSDQYVGWTAYFLDDEFVFLTSQSARKSDVYYNWESMESRNKVKNYIRSLADVESVYDEIDILNPNDEIDNYFQISYRRQLMATHKARLFNIHSGLNVKYVCDVCTDSRCVSCLDCKYIKVQYPDGEICDVLLNNIGISYIEHKENHAVVIDAGTCHFRIFLRNEGVGYYGRFGTYQVSGRTYSDVYWKIMNKLKVNN